MVQFLSRFIIACRKKEFLKDFTIITNGPIKTISDLNRKEEINTKKPKILFFCSTGRLTAKPN